MADITTNNLSFNEVVQGTGNEGAQVNDALGNFDAFQTEVLEVDLTSGSYELATDPPEFKRYRKYRVINATGGSPADTLTVRALSRMFYVDTTDNSNTEAISVSLGSTDIAQAAGVIRLYETDGTANGLALVNLGGGGSVAVQEGGETILAEPTAINFTGTGVAVSDEGGGVVEVAITAGDGSGDVVGPDGGVAAGELAQYADTTGKEIEGSGVPVTELVLSDDIRNIVSLTQAEYDGLSPVDANTLYLITDA